MDCYEAVDDFCEAWQAEDLLLHDHDNNVIPPIGNSDQFFISFELEVTYPLIQEDEDDDETDYEEIDDELVRVESRDCVTMWAPCPRVESGNLSRDAISGMLSAVGVPLHKQLFMVDRISSLADAIANEASNRNRRILPMRVFVSIVACLCYGESVDDPDHSIIS